MAPEGSSRRSLWASKGSRSEAKQEVSVSRQRGSSPFTGSDGIGTRKQHERTRQSRGTALTGSWREHQNNSQGHRPRSRHLLNLTAAGTGPAGVSPPGLSPAPSTDTEQSQLGPRQRINDQRCLGGATGDRPPPAVDQLQRLGRAGGSSGFWVVLQHQYGGLVGEESDRQAPPTNTLQVSPEPPANDGALNKQQRLRWAVRAATRGDRSAATAPVVARCALPTQKAVKPLPDNSVVRR